MTEIERRLKKAEQSGKITTSTQTERSAASSYSETSDTARRLRIAEEQNRKYSAPEANRRAAMQRKTESWMDFTTEEEPEAQAAIDRYKATEDAKYYAEMNQRGATIGNDAMQERGYAGYKKAAAKWREGYHKGLNSEPVTDDTLEGVQREQNYWAEAAKQAAQFGDQARYNMAVQNVAKYQDDQYNIQKDEYAEELDALRQSNPAEYYALTMTDDEIDRLIAYFDFEDKNNAGRSAYGVTRTPEEEARLLRGMRQSRFVGESDADHDAAVRAEKERYDRDVAAYKNRRTVMDDTTGRTLRTVADDPHWVEYFDRTPEEQAEYINNLRRARFVGESDAEREAYIQGEQDLYAEQFRNYQNGPDYSSNLATDMINAESNIKSLELAKAIHELDRVDKSPANIEAGRSALWAQQGNLLKENGFYYDRETMSHIANGAGPADSKDYQKMIDKGYVLYSDFYELPEDQRNNVYAVAATDPEKAVSLAQHYLKLAEDEHYQKIYDWVNKNSGWQFGRRALGMVGGAAAKLVSGLDPYGTMGQSMSKTGNALISGGAASASRSGLFGIEFLGGDESPISADIPFLGKGQAGLTYQVGASVLQSAAIAAPAMIAGNYSTAAAKVAETIGLVLMGSSAAADDYTRCIENGMTVDQARLHATAAGVAEAAFERISLDKLVDPDLTINALQRWLQQAGIEASEEVCTSIANRISDELLTDIYGVESDVDRRTRELVADGLSYNVARDKAKNEWITEVIQDGMSGFLSGLIMGGGSEVIRGAAKMGGKTLNVVETRKEKTKTGAAVSRSEGSVEALQAYAKDKGIEIKAVETAEQNAEQGEQGAAQNSYSNRDYRSISDTNSKVLQSIRSEVRGKTVQEQQTIRDNLVEKYGEGIAPVVNHAISVETAAHVRQEYGSVDSIQAARNQAVSEIKDESLRQAVSDGYDSAAYAIAASQGGESGMNTMSRYIQQRKNTGSGSEMSMNATVTAQDGSTKTIAITGMSEDGKRVSLADGSEVAVKDLQADADTTSAIQQLADLDLGADATKVLEAYQQSGVSGTEGYRWLMDYATAYNQGRTRQISLEQAAQRSSLDERTVMDAYTLGQQSANRETQAGLEKLKNLPKRKGASGRTANIDTTEIKGKTMSKSELEQFELANQYAQALGVDMVWFSSREQGGKFIDKNGAYENGKIYMDIHAGRNFTADLTSGILATMGHELTHFQQQYAPEEYQALKEFLFEQIAKSSPNGEARLERLIWEKQKRSGNTLGRKAAEDEVVADACQKMLRDSKAVHDFASQQPEAANGIVRWLDKWFKKVRSIFGRGGNYSEEAQIMDSLEQDVKAAFGDLWDKALKQATKVHDEVEDMESERDGKNSDRDYNQTVVLTEQTVDKYLADYAAKSSPNYAQAYIVRMSPNQFLDLTTSKIGRNRIYSETGEMDVEKLKEASIQQPFQLRIDSKTGQVEGHEGRHRAMALSNNGITSIPVLLFDSSNKYNKTAMESLELHGQDFGTSRSFATVTVQDVQPLSYANRDNVVQKFTTQPSRERIREKYSDTETIRYSDRDAEYLELAKDPEKNAGRLQEMVDEAAKRAGFTSPMLFHGTNAFGFTTIKTSKDVHADGFSFWAANKESAAGTYTRYGKTRAIESEISYEETEEAIEKRSADVDEAIDNFRYLIDRTFSEWFYGQQGNEVIRRGVDDSNPDPGSGDGVYDFLVDQVADAFNEYSDSLSETYEDFADFQERSEEWEKIEDAIVAIEGAYSALSEIQREGLVGGIYELYANTDNMYVVDANGAAWDALHPEGLPKIERGEFKNVPYKTRDVANWARDNGYDGVIFKNIKDNGAYGRTEPFDVYAFFNPQAQVKSADPVTYDDNGNVIPLSERFNEANEDIRFSMREPVEQTDRLIAWHNMNEDALRSALELGGLAMPSWAIKTADRAHTSYGSISVIAPRALVDPKINRSSMIFGGDAWTPVFPGVDYKISYDAVDRLESEIKGLIGEDIYREIGGTALDADNIGDQLERNGGALPNHYKNHPALRLAYLKSIGQDINIPTKESALDRDGLISNGAVQWFSNHLTYGKKSLDYYREMYSQELMEQDDLLKAISDAILQEYKKTLPERAYEKLKGKYEPENLSFHTVNGMLDAANRYFTSGIEKTTDKHALGQEIDKIIDEASYERWILDKLNATIEKKGIRNDKDMFTPSGNRRSFDALHYAYNLANIVKAMKAQPKQGRTQFLSGPGSVKGAALKSYNTVEQVREDRGRLVNSEEEGQEAYDEYNRNLEDILDRMSKNGDRFDAADALIEVFQHAKTESGIYNYMQRELKDWYNISHELAHDAYELIGQINRMPMEYFEGKTYDAVPFDETAAVVVPDNIDPALKQQLNDAGARVVEYKAGDDSDRLAKVNSVEGAQFSERDYSTPSDEELLMQAKADDATSKNMRQLLTEYQERGREVEKMEAKLSSLKEERNAWREKSKHGGMYAQGLIDSKNRDIAKLEKQIQKYRDIMAGKAKSQELNKLLKAERERAETRVREQKEAQFTRYKEGKKAGELRRRITRHSKELYGKLTKPSDKRHIPEAYRGAVAALLNTINLESAYDIQEGTKNESGRGGKHVEKGTGTATNRTKAFQEVRKQLEQVLAEGGFTGELINNAAEGFDGGLIEKCQDFADKPISTLSSEELETLWNTIRALEHNITTFNKAFALAKTETISGIADKFLASAQKRKPLLKDPKSRLDLKIKKTSGAALKALENPYTFFSHYGEEGVKLFRALRDAQDLVMVRTNHLSDLWVRKMAAILGDEKTAKLHGDKLTDAILDKIRDTSKQMDEKVETFRLANGQTITLTHAMLMDVYLLAQRGEVGMNHLLGSGLIQPEIRAKGKYVARDPSFRKLSLEDVQKLTGVITENATEKAIADAIQSMQHQLADWGNEASMAVFGYRKFTEDNYWPVKNAKEENKSDSGKGGNQPANAMNKGMAKNLVPHAATGMEPMSAFTKLQGSISDMLVYATWGPVMEDFKRFYNWKWINPEGGTSDTVKGVMERYGGEGSQRYWEELRDQINNGVGGGKGSADQLIGKAVGAVKGARVAFNLRVVVQQPTAYARAGEVISGKYLAASLLDIKSWGWKAKSAWNRALTHSPIAMRKNSTTYDMGGNISAGGEFGLDRPGYLDKARDFGTALAGKADAITWGRLWHAAELQVSAKTNLEHGSQEYWDAVNKLFTEAVDRTQVVDGLLQRPAIMRTDSDFVKGATSYMGEPLMQLNMLMRQVNDFRQTGFKATKKQIAKTVTALVVTQLINAMLTGLYDAGIRKDDKDKDFWERFVAEITGIDGTEGNAWDYITSIWLESNAVSEMSVMQKIPLLKDVLSMLQGYDPSNNRMDLEAIKDLIDVCTKVLWNDKYTPLYKAKEIINKASMIFGAGFGNALKDMYGVTRNIINDFGKPQARFDFKALWLNPASKKNKSQYFDLLFQMLENGDKDAFRQRAKKLAGQDGMLQYVAKSAIERYLTDGLSPADVWDMMEAARDDGMSDEKFFEYAHGRMADAFKESYFNGKLEDDQAVTLLMQYSGKNEKDAWNAVRKWKDQAKHVGADGKLPDDYRWNQYDELTEAVANGEDVTDLLTEYRNHGYSNNQINGAIRSSIQEAMASGYLDEKEAASALIRYGVTYSKDGKTMVYDKQSAWKKVQEWADEAEHTDEEGEPEDGYKYSAYSDLFEAVDANQDAEKVIKEMVQNGGYDADSLREQIKDHLSERFIAGEITETALKNQLARYCKITKTEDANKIVANLKCKRDYGVYPDDLKEAFKDGDLSQNQAEKALQQYKGLSKTDAQNRVQYWGYDGELSETAWLKWNNELKGSGLSVENWEKVSKVKSDAKGTDANGDGKADYGTAKAEVVSYIDSMNIPKSQKKAIYLAFGFAASTMPSWR